MQAEDLAGTKLERTLAVLHVGSNKFERLLELSDAVLGFALRYFYRVREQRGRFGDTVTIARHLLTFSLQAAHRDPRPFHV